jgi:hypothetical protein
MLHDEFLESDVFKKLSITINKFSPFTMSGPDLVVLDQLPKSALAHIKHLTFFVQCFPLSDELFEWGPVASNAPYLSSVRIAVQQTDRGVSDQLLVAQPYRTEILEKWKLPDPPTTLAGLPPVQRGEGFHYACVWTRIWESAPPRWSTIYDNMRHSELSIHDASNISILLYAKDKAEKYMWQQKDIIELLKPGAYEPDLLRRFTPERAAVL